MSYEVELLPNQPVVFMTWYEDFSLKDYLEPASEQARRILDSAPDTLFKHTNISQVILISQSSALELTAKGMKATTCGNMNVCGFLSR